MFVGIITNEEAAVVDSSLLDSGTGTSLTTLLAIISSFLEPSGVAVSTLALNTS